MRIALQVYDKLNILTNKPNIKELKSSECKLFSFSSLSRKKCNVGLWRNKAIELLKDIKKKYPYICGWNWSLS